MLVALRARASDSGETLVELLMTLVILSLAVVAIMSALATSATSSTLNKTQGKVNALLSAAAESVRAIGFQSCNAAAPVPAVPKDNGYTVTVSAPQPANIGGSTVPCVNGLESFHITVTAPAEKGTITAGQDVLLPCRGLMVGQVCQLS